MSGVHDRRGVHSGTLILICGLPGSGKTTLARRLQEERGAIRLSADDWMTSLAVNLHDEGFRAKIESLQWKVGRELLQHGSSVIVEWGSWGRGEREQLRNDARAAGASIEFHYLSATVDELFARIQARNMEDPPITRESVEHWATLMEVPDAVEPALYDSVHITDS